MNIVLASNRGPIQYELTAEGKLVPKRGSGGVVAALSSVQGHLPFVWVCTPMTKGDLCVANGDLGHGVLDGDGCRPTNLEFVVLSADTYRKYYDVISNGILWFFHHYMLDLSREQCVGDSIAEAWDSGYTRANRAFAEKVVEVSSRRDGRPVVLIQDYHLLLTPRMVKEWMPYAVVEYFSHIPWPEPRYWQMLPPWMSRAIFNGLLGADIAGFQTPQDGANFLSACGEVVPGAAVDLEAGEAYFEGHSCRVRSYPISVDPAELRRTLRSPEGRGFIERLRTLAGEKTIVRVDRIEPTKNLVQGFRAFELLLERNPDLLGKTRLLAFLVGCRERLSVYRRYRREVLDIIEQVNARFGTEGWRPIEVFLENNYVQALAGLSLYDVLLVNPIIDGMNLVAKEGPAVNTRNGVLVLSSAAGAYRQLKEGALSVAPSDLEGTVQALEQALRMPLRERKRLAQLLRQAVEQEDIRLWVELQLADIEQLIIERDYTPASRQRAA